MQKEAKEPVKRPSAFTLVELILVAGTIALIAAALAGLVHNSYEDWKLGSDRSTLLQDGQAAIEQMVRFLRQAKGFDAVSSPTEQVGYITFKDADGDLKEFRLDNSTSELKYGEPDDLSVLTGSVSGLAFICYDINGNALTGSVPAKSIQSVQIEMALTDGTNSFTLSGRVFCPTDFKCVVINELMYNPSGSGDDAPKEWVELYNLSDSSVDLTGWTIGNDSLAAHPQFGDGSTTIPAGGYAIITAETTTVFEELTTGGDFESKQDFQNNWTSNNWDRTKWNAHNGSYKGESSVSGSASLYTDISVPSSLNSCLFLFWEMTTASVDQTQITVTIRNLSDQVLTTGYSGQMSSDWTCHTMDLTAYANQDIRIHFSTNKTTGDGALLLDDIFAASSYVDLDAIRLSCGDNQIGGGLADNGDTVTVADSIATVDSVTYDDGWGGDGDGTSLARIDPQGSSNDEDNWTSGPQNGTPGSAN